MSEILLRRSMFCFSLQEIWRCFTVFVYLGSCEVLREGKGGSIYMFDIYFRCVFS